MILAYRGKTEIAWKVVSYQMIDHIYDELGFAGPVHHGISYFHKDDPFLNLRYEDADFRGELSEKFVLSEARPNRAELAFLHRPSIDDLASGYITEDHRRAFVVGAGFGLFKSAVSGFASLQMESAGYVPAHAAALSLDGKGILLVGGSRGGKTTTMFNVAIHALRGRREVRILCDDWLVVTPVDGRLVASTFDPSISLTQPDLERAISLEGIDELALLNRLKSRNKISVPPSSLFGPQVQAREIVIDTIVLINPSTGFDRFNLCEGEGADFIIDSAYHFPYVDQEMRNRHHKFWTAWSDRISVYEYSYLGALDLELSISCIVDSLSSVP